MVVVGSPFHSAVVNPSRVQLLGGWESVLDARSKALSLHLHEPFSLEFDTRTAGPGIHFVLSSCHTAQLISPDLTNKNIFNILMYHFTYCIWFYAFLCIVYCLLWSVWEKHCTTVHNVQDDWRWLVTSSLSSFGWQTRESEIQCTGATVASGQNNLTWRCPAHFRTLTQLLETAPYRTFSHLTF